MFSGMYKKFSVAVVVLIRGRRELECQRERERKDREGVKIENRWKPQGKSSVFSWPNSEKCPTGNSMKKKEAARRKWE